MLPIDVANDVANEVANGDECRWNYIILRLRVRVPPAARAAP
jgi:hypothetical protein